MTCDWLEQWKLLSARILGVGHAATYLAHSMQRTSSDSYGVSNFLQSELTAIYEELNALNKEENLPERAKTYLSASLENAALKSIVQKSPKPEHPAAPFIAFAATFEYLIADTDIVIRSRTERAFEHLKRSVAVDAFILKNDKNNEERQTTWQKAYEKGEIVCEKLGAVHLLQHGIWAFKVNGEGGRTDLVYEESPIDQQSVRSTASNLVLTEWKKVTEKTEKRDVKKIIQDSQKQIGEYSSGVLGGIELKNTHYIILISNQNLELPQEPDPINSIKYRYINIPVNPDIASKH